MKGLLIGNYGVGNLGDELLREYFLSTFRDIDWLVVSARPSRRGEVHRLPCGIRSFCGLRWIGTLRAYRRSDVVVFGGGSLFTDVESIKACILWFFHALPAIILRKPIILAFQGIGPCTSCLGRCITRYVCRRSLSISVRDSTSVQRLADWGIDQNVVQTFDPVYMSFYREKTKNVFNNILTVIPRKNVSDSFWITFDSLNIDGRYEHIRIVLLEPDHSMERAAAEELLRRSGDRGLILSVTNTEELLGAIDGSTHVLSMRYHGALAALGLGIPFTVASQGADDKLQSLVPYAAATDADRGQLLALARAGEDALKKVLSSLPSF